jgi:SAM-dependent methyltransferase
MAIDWSDGDYGHTATRLDPIAIAVVQQLGIAAGQRVLDVGCGTGNAALAAARAGAAVTGVDPAAGLLSLARRRAREDGLDIEFVAGDAERLPVAGEFDAVMSVFGVIFAADAAQAAREMLRVTRPSGVVALTSWCPVGGINAVADVLWDAFPKPDGSVNRWGDPEWIASLLTQEGAERVTIDEAEHVVRAESPEAWFTETEELHPAWRGARRMLPAERWDLVRRDSLAALRDWNEDPEGFATTSRYLFVRATR